MWGQCVHRDGAERPGVSSASDRTSRTAPSRTRGARNDRDPAACERALAALTDASRGEDNPIPHILEATRAYATVGEIAEAMASV